MPSTTTDHSHSLTYPAEGATGWFSTIVTYHQAITDALDNIGVTEITTIDDANSNEMVVFSATASAVNHIQIANGATGSGPTLNAVGDDTNIDLSLTPKGSGNLVLDGLSWPNADGSANQVLETDGAGNLSWAAAGGSPAMNDITDVTVTAAAKGDILVYNGSAWVDLTVGSDGQILSSNSAQATGLEWVADGGGLSNVVEDTTPQLGGQLDVNGNAIGDGTNELLTFTEDASAVNHLNIENEATGSGPILSSAGDDTNIDLNITPKGTGKIVLDGLAWPNTDGTANYVLETDGAGTLGWVANAGGGGLSNVVDDTTPQLGGQLDVNGNAIGDGTRELITFTEDASAVNHINIENEATGSGPIISSAGDDTNIDLNITPKGTGAVKLDGLSWPTADGSAGQFLQTDGSAALSFTGLAWEFIASDTASTSATIDFESLGSTYKALKLIVNHAAPDTDAVSFRMLVGTGGTPTYVTSANYDFTRSEIDTGGTEYLGAFSGGTSLQMTRADVGTATAETVCMEIVFSDVADSSNYTHCHWRGSYVDTSGNGRYTSGAAMYTVATAVTAIRCIFSSGNIESGDFYLYGLRGT